ncbi:MAG: ATP-binding protein [bacterium]|nr:ATP-binding protein [bacterium]MDZ4260027.1 ATP-binding protein [Candidatus Sungbacteria bacterium]
MQTSIAQKKFLIALTGPVGSGKSHIAKILATKLKAVHIRTDDIRVELRGQGKTYEAAPRIAAKLRDQALKQGQSVIADFDAVLPRRQRELKKIAEKYGAHFFLIRIDTPEEVILRRLRNKRYTKKELFKNASEAIRVYHIRKNLHEKQLQSVPDFAINNGKPLAAQINRIVKQIRVEKVYSG